MVGGDRTCNGYMHNESPYPDTVGRWDQTHESR
jgi:hypothetical protein